MGGKFERSKYIKLNLKSKIDSILTLRSPELKNKINGKINGTVYTILLFINCIINASINANKYKIANNLIKYKTKYEKEDIS